MNLALASERSTKPPIGFQESTPNGSLEAIESKGRAFLVVGVPYVIFWILLERKVTLNQISKETRLRREVLGD